MAEQMTFKRYEIKYRVTKEEKARILEAMAAHMIPDEHGRSVIQSMYYDTPDFRLARKAMEKPEYKEKLRLRSYGVAKDDTGVFIELKKKYDGVVYKRRIQMSSKEAESYLNHGIDTGYEAKASRKDVQIKKEIDYCFANYTHLQPQIMLSYEREAFYDKDDHEIRMTFDEHVLWRNYDLSMTRGIYGEPVLDEGYSLLEIKVLGSMPLWMSKVLAELKIYPKSFSKYGTAYTILYDRMKNALEPSLRTSFAGSAILLGQTAYNGRKRPEVAYS